MKWKWQLSRVMILCVSGRRNVGSLPMFWVWHLTAQSDSLEITLSGLHCGTWFTKLKFKLESHKLSFAFHSQRFESRWLLWLIILGHVLMHQACWKHASPWWVSTIQEILSWWSFRDTMGKPGIIFWPFDIWMPKLRVFGINLWNSIADTFFRAFKFWARTLTFEFSNVEVWHWSVSFVI